LWDFEDIGDWWTRADPAAIATHLWLVATHGGHRIRGSGGLSVITNSGEHNRKRSFTQIHAGPLVILWTPNWDRRHAGFHSLKARGLDGPLPFASAKEFSFLLAALFSYQYILRYVRIGGSSSSIIKGYTRI